MNRRHFLETGLVTGIGSVTQSGAVAQALFDPKVSSTRDKIGGLTLEEVAAVYRKQLFDEYLPFWERGGYDEERGGFMCYLYDDGSVQDDRKDIWFQGRCVWVYSFLYNNIDSNPKWLDVARKSGDFMVDRMHKGDGTWIPVVNRFGEPVDGLGNRRAVNIYGALFAAVGLIQLALATGSDEDLQIAKKTIRRSVERYEDPAYAGITAPDSRELGLRSQGHSFMLVWVVSQLLQAESDPWFESLARQHLDLIAERFWNPEYGISNEKLFHDYSRIPTLVDRMAPGHSIETQWMAMVTASQFGDETQAAVFRSRMRRLIEMSWDYVFGGIGDSDYRVFASESHAIGPEFGMKTMWAQAEVLIGTMRVFADGGDLWALEWYERTWEYLQRTMVTDYGVWRRAVDRSGQGIDRSRSSAYQKDDFHQPRCLMLNLLQVERLIERDEEGQR